MKAEHKKELETNTLANSLGNLIEGMKDKPGQMSYIVWGFVLLVAASVGGWYYFKTQKAKQNSAQWVKVAESYSDDDLRKIEKNHKNTPAGRIARLKLARTLMEQAQPQLFAPDPKTKDTPKITALMPEGIGKTQAREKLEEAAKIFEDLGKEFTDLPLLAQECMMSAASAKISLGDIDAGVKLYENLAKKYPKTEAAEKAEQAAERYKKNKEEVERLTKSLDSGGIPSFHP